MITTEFKTLVLKHRTLQITEAGDKNQNETNKVKLFALISLKIIHHLHTKIQKMHKEVTV